MTRLDIDPRFAAAHYQDGRDLHGAQNRGDSTSGDLLPLNAARTSGVVLQVVARRIARELRSMRQDHFDAMYPHIWAAELEAASEEQVAQHSGGHLVRYCFECGTIGEVSPPFLACCPDNRRDFVRREIAEQARAGFDAMLPPATPLGGVSVPPEVAGQRPSQDHPESCGSTQPAAAQSEALGDLMRTSEELGAYTQPAAVPAYQPMTEEERLAMFYQHQNKHPKADMVSFLRGIEAAESAVLARVAAAPAAAPVAWRVRGYAAFKTGEPGPWRYVDGPARPKVNNPECCDFEPLYLAAPAAVQPDERDFATRGWLAALSDARYAARGNDWLVSKLAEIHVHLANAAAVQPVAQQQPSVHQVVGSGLPSQAVRTGGEGWLPIATAPKNGEYLTLLVMTNVRPSPLPMTGRWFHGVPGCWVIVNADLAIQLVEPSHWMPLPPAPQLGAVSVPAETASGAKQQDEPKQPLTDAEIRREFKRIPDDDNHPAVFDLVDFQAGVRFAERHHGITGGSSNE